MYTSCSHVHARHNGRVDQQWFHSTVAVRGPPQQHVAQCGNAVLSKFDYLSLAVAINPPTLVPATQHQQQVTQLGDWVVVLVHLELDVGNCRYYCCGGKQQPTICSGQQQRNNQDYQIGKFYALMKLTSFFVVSATGGSLTNLVPFPCSERARKI